MDEIAVVGMDIAFGPCGDIEAFGRAVYEGLAGPIPEQMSERGLRPMLDRALEDTSRGTTDAVALLLISREVAAEQVLKAWGFSGPCSNLAATTSSVFEALQMAQTLLSRKTVDTVLIGIGDDDASAVILLQRLAFAQRQPRRIYAVLNALCLDECGEQASAKAVLRTCSQALNTARIRADAVDYIEITDTALVQQDAGMLTGLLQAYRSARNPLTCALGSVRRLLSSSVDTSTDASKGTACCFSAAFAGIAGVLKTILCLHQRFIPVLIDWPGPDEPELWEMSSCYIPANSRPWFLKNRSSKRWAAVHTTTSDGICAHLIWSDYSHQSSTGYDLKERPCFLFPIAASDRGSLVAKLQKLQSKLRHVASTPYALREVARETRAVYQRQKAAPFTLALVGRDKAELSRELQFAFKGVNKAYRTAKDWHSPRGSYFTTSPLGGRDALAFVYPGAFNSYLNMGRGLFRYFPDLHESFAALVSDVGGVFAESAIYPRSLDRFSEKARISYESRLMQDPTALITSGTSMAVLLTRIMREYFRARPQFAFGYSLGEVSMLWATGVWKSGEAGYQAWFKSPLFKTRLSGAKEVVREQWHDLKPGDDNFWRTYLLKASPAEVQACLRGEPRVYLMIINTPDEVVIAGDPDGCQRVIAELQCHALPLSYDAVIHTAIMRAEYPAFVQLYTNPVCSQPDLQFFSSAADVPLVLESDALAHTLADVTCTQVDFPKLVNRAYDAGARVFVELGPLGTCSRWISRILKDRDHVAVATNKRGTDDLVALTGVLATLLSHRVDVDISWLYGQELAIQETQPSFSNYHNVYRQSHAQRTRIVDTHSMFLQERHDALCRSSELIRLQIQTSRHLLDQAAGKPVAARLHFDEAQLRAFATGSIAQCFGPAYALEDGRRVPRIPNGDLRFISRVLDIQGVSGTVVPGATAVSAYDVPVDAWFYRQGRYPVVPYAVLMEMALQPCGFLSAYLGSILPYPGLDFYFRNLDGWGELDTVVDLRGKTVVDEVELISSTAVQDIILQKYGFALSCEGRPLYTGEATFGYFTTEALGKQIGLDDGNPSVPWCFHSEVINLPSDTPTTVILAFTNVELRQRFFDPPPGVPHAALRSGQLALLDEVRIVSEGGAHGKGYVYARASVDPQAWFFACHFYQDPVMPGSLGIEAIIQALQTYVLHQNLGRHLTKPHFEQVPGHKVTWSYRGQVLPDSGMLQVEVHITRVEVASTEVTVIGDASLWRQNLRIYEVKQVAVRLMGET